MNTNQEALAAGILGGSLAMMAVIALVLWVLCIIARWKVFTKAGEAGWKSIIPIYADYVQWRIGWKKTNLFWVMLILIIAAFIIGPATGAFVIGPRGNIVSAPDPGIGGVIFVVLILVAVVLNLIAVYKLFASFGHGIGWFIGYIFLSYIMLLVLGFGSSRYLGPQD